MLLDHKHLIIDAVCANPLIDPEKTINWLRKVVEAVGMKIKIGPFADYCTAEENNGITAAVCIETSHASIHFWDKTDPPHFRFDLYSCAFFEKNAVFDLLKDFDTYYFDYVLLDRNKSIKIIERGWHQSKPVIDLLSVQEKEIYLSAQRQKNKGEKLTDEQKKARASYARLSNKYGRGNIERKRRYLKNHYSTIKCISERARKKNLAFDLTTDWYEEQLKIAKQKYPKLIEHSKKQSFWSADVDRIEPAKGYVKENCRIIPHCLNVMKWNWSAEELEELPRIIEDYFQNRIIN